MAANLITIGRVILSFLIVLMFQGDFEWRAAAILLIFFVIYLDALDGIVARKLSQCSKHGALLDIAGDRIVEHVFWIAFAASGLISYWVPIIFLSRSFIVDMLRFSEFASTGNTPFGGQKQKSRRFIDLLTASRFSRAAYGTLKVVSFALAGVLLALPLRPESLYLADSQVQQLRLLTDIVVWTTVGFNLIRGSAVIWAHRHVFTTAENARDTSNKHNNQTAKLEH